MPIVSLLPAIRFVRVIRNEHDILLGKLSVIRKHFLSATMLAALIMPGASQADSLTTTKTNNYGVPSGLIDMPTATADTVKVTGLAERLVETAKAFRSAYRPELLCAPRRPARGYLSIGKMSQHHEMIEPSLDP